MTQDNTEVVEYTAGGKYPIHVPKEKGILTIEYNQHHCSDFITFAEVEEALIKSGLKRDDNWRVVSRERFAKLLGDQCCDIPEVKK